MDACGAFFAFNRAHLLGFHTASLSLPHEIQARFSLNIKLILVLCPILPDDDEEVRVEQERPVIANRTP